jgi:2-desacetyl-2-hydroxyethyl bacteriochlorophyllide A dehydrogenase
MKKMKAVRIHGPSKVSIDEIPLQEPGDHDVVIRVKAAGLCGTDYDLYTNDMVYINEGMAKLPIVPGHEWSGIVERVGRKASVFKPGDRVSGECTVSCGKCGFCLQGRVSQCLDRTETGILNREGGFAEYIVFPESHLHKFEKVPFEEAALIEPTGIALNAAIRGGITPLDNVLVMGAGAVGLQAAQIAKKIYGARKVILTDIIDARLDRARNYGLDGKVNPSREDLKEKVTEITKGRMIDILIEASGSKDAFINAKEVVRPFGRIVLIGFFGSKKPVIEWDSFITRDITMIGALGSPGIWDDVIDMLDSGVIETRSLISHEMKFEDFEKGLELMVSRKDNALKVILKP